MRNPKSYEMMMMMMMMMMMLVVMMMMMPQIERNVKYEITMMMISKSKEI